MLKRATRYVFVLPALIVGLNACSGDSSSDKDTSGLSANVNIMANGDLVTSEAGTNASLDVVLESRPTANVLLNIVSDNETEGNPAANQLIFTPENWDTRQSITIQGEDDDIDDGDIDYGIEISISSDDPSYQGLENRRFSLTNRDDDTAAITVGADANLTVSETGDSVSFTVKLASEPTQPVTIPLALNDDSEASLSVSSIVFSSSDWNRAQTVTVTGKPDQLVDGDVVFTALLGVPDTMDENYQAIIPEDVDITNLDADIAGVTVTPVQGLITDETGRSASFTVALDAAPMANVVVDLSSGNTDEGNVTPEQLIFTPDDWGEKTVTVTGQDDDIVDGNTVYSIITSDTQSEQVQYHGLAVADVSVTNENDDTGGVTVSPTQGLITDESGRSATFTVALVAPPGQNVVIDLNSNNPEEGTVSPSRLTFTRNDWSAKTVTVTGVNDDVVDGNVTYAIVTSNTQSSLAEFNNIDVADVTVVNENNDLAGITVTPTDGLITNESGTTASFTVGLDAAPLQNVLVSLNSSDDSEGSVSPQQLTFTPADWGPKTVTVTGADDAVMDGSVPYSIITSNTRSIQSEYNNIDVADVQLLNENNDEVPDHRGTDFILGFLPIDSANNPFSHYVYLVFTSDAQTTINVEYPVGTQVATIDMAPNDLQTYYLDTAASSAWSHMTVSNNAVRVSADKEFSVTLNNAKGIQDMAMGLPISVLDNEYYIMSSAPGQRYGSHFLVIATEDNTGVTLDVSDQTNPVNVTLNRGEGYFMRSRLLYTQVTGSHVRADKPVAVFNGNKCAGIPAGQRYCEHLFEMALPVSAWGTSYIGVNYKEAANFAGTRRTFYRVLASQANTNLVVDGTLTRIMGAGEVFARTVEAGSEAVHFTADQPILVTQYMNSLCDEFPNSEGCTNELAQIPTREFGDPSMANLIPVDAFPVYYTFTNPGSTYTRVSIVATTSDANNSRVFIDGNAIAPDEFTDLTTGWSYADIIIRACSRGTVCNREFHTSRSDQGHSVILYGMGYFRALSAPAGMNF